MSFCLNNFLLKYLAGSMLQITLSLNSSFHLSQSYLNNLFQKTRTQYSGAMALHQTGLLKEYLLADATLSLFGGKKCYWDPINEKIHIRSKPYIICLLMGIVFGVTQEIKSFALVFQQKHEDSSKHAGDYRSIGLIFGVGTFFVYCVSWSSIRTKMLLQAFVNNVLQMEKLHGKHLTGIFFHISENLKIC